MAQITPGTRPATALVLTLILALAMLPMAGAQETKPDSTATQQVPSAGGPEGDTGPYAVPKKPAQPAPPPEKPKPVRNPAELGDITIRRDVPVVNVDVMVTTQNGQFIPGLHQNNFRVLEDGTPQQISTFGISQAPVTAVLLVEFASTWWPFSNSTLKAAFGSFSLTTPMTRGFSSLLLPSRGMHPPAD